MASAVSASALLIWSEFGQAHANLLLIELLVHIDASIVIAPIDLVTLDRIEAFGHLLLKFANLFLQLVKVVTLAPGVVLQQLCLVLEDLKLTLHLESIS